MNYRITYHFYCITGRENCHYIVNCTELQNFIDMWRMFKDSMEDVKVEALV